MRILYFAWLKSTVGIGEETVDPPVTVKTLGQLIDWLITRSPKHAAAFANRERIRAAINLDYAKLDQPVSANDEVAFFPPVTGG